MAKGKLKNLFKKKEGGTFVGNLLRKAGDTFTGGAYSSLFPKPTAQDVASQSNKLGLNKDAQISMDYDGPQEKLNVQVSDPNQTPKPWYLQLPVIIGGAVVVIGGILLMVFKKKK